MLRRRRHGQQSHRPVDGLWRLALWVGALALLPLAPAMAACPDPAKPPKAFVLTDDTGLKLEVAIGDDGITTAKGESPLGTAKPTFLRALHGLIPLENRSYQGDKAYISLTVYPETLSKETLALKPGSRLGMTATSVAYEDKGVGPPSAASLPRFESRVEDLALRDEILEIGPCKVPVLVIRRTVVHSPEVTTMTLHRWSRPLQFEFSRELDPASPAKGTIQTVTYVAIEAK